MIKPTNNQDVLRNGMKYREITFMNKLAMNFKCDLSRKIIHMSQRMIHYEIDSNTKRYK